MKHFAAIINSGSVENIIVIEPAGIPAFQEAVGCDYLIPVSEAVAVGDAYDSETGVFSRGGERVYPEITDKERIAALEDAMCEMDEANAERFAAIEDALCDIDAGAAE